MRKLAALTVLLLGTTVFAGNFSISGEKDDLVIKYNDEVLVKALKVRAPEPFTKFDYKVLPDGSRVWNAWNENPDNKYRREIALRIFALVAI